ncbi:MAG: hypothetical protein Q8O74_07080 [bacterium]|nr:hypothetical protein [bacterium]
MTYTQYSPIMESSFKSQAIGNEAAHIKQRGIQAQENYLGKSYYVTGSLVKIHFERLKNIWLDDILFTSNMDEIVNHPAYLAVISFGHEILPFIIEDLKTSDHLWFRALEAITGINPIKKENIGNMRKMREDWLVWIGENY